MWSEFEAEWRPLRLITFDRNWTYLRGPLRWHMRLLSSTMQGTFLIRPGLYSKAVTKYCLLNIVHRVSCDGVCTSDPCVYNSYRRSRRCEDCFHETGDPRTHLRANRPSVRRCTARSTSRCVSTISQRCPWASPRACICCPSNAIIGDAALSGRIQTCAARHIETLHPHDA